MSTYFRLYFANQDAPIGYQTINVGIGNLNAVYDAFDLDHIVEDISLSSDGPQLGQHDTPNVPREVMQVLGSVYAGSLSTGGFLVSPNPPTFAPFTYARALTRISTGVYFIPIVGLASFWGQAIGTVTSSGSVPCIQCRSSINNGLNISQGITVTCYELSSGTFTLTDMDFTLTISGTR